MPREAPQMIAGMKAPMQVRLEESKKQGPVESVAPKGKRSEAVVYQSNIRKYRVQITSPAEVFDPSTGIKTRKKPVVAQFEDCFFVNEKFDRAGKPNPDFDIINERLQTNSSYGIGLDYWLFSDMEEKTRKSALDHAKRQLQDAPPEVVDAFVKDLAAAGKLEHVLPRREAPQAAKE